MRSGLRFSTGDSSQTGANVDKDVTYELSYVHRKRGLTIRAGLVRLFGSVFSMFTGAGAVTKNKLRGQPPNWRNADRESRCRGTGVPCR